MSTAPKLSEAIEKLGAHPREQAPPAPPPRDWTLMPAEVDLSQFPFMPLRIDQLMKSKAWLIARRKRELAYHYINFWTRLFHEKPAGSIEDDEDVLCAAADCHPKDWATLRDDILRGTIVRDGRRYHPVVCEIAWGSWRGKLWHEYANARDRARKDAKAVTAGGGIARPVPTFETWCLLKHPDSAQFFADGNETIANGKSEKADGIWVLARQQLPLFPTEIGRSPTARRRIPSAERQTPSENERAPTERARGPTERDEIPTENSLKGEGEKNPPLPPTPEPDAVDAWPGRRRRLREW